jgi:hypothetical protein
MSKMDRPLSHHWPIVDGLRRLRENTLRVTENSVKKVLSAQEAFLHRNPHLYGVDEQRYLQYTLEGALHKYLMASLNLEQLHSLSLTLHDEAVISGVYEKLSFEASDDDLLLVTWSFEGFLFQSRAFLDFYRIYLCAYLQEPHRGYMSSKQFKAKLRDAKRGPFAEKAGRIETYFDEGVFAPDPSISDVSAPKNWGTVLKSLRDKVAHWQQIQPSFDASEDANWPFKFNWPTLQQVGYDKFCQAMQNGMFFLLYEMLPVLYDLEWKPGLHRDDLWSE